MYIQSPQKILLALARKSLLGKTKHKSRKAGSLGSPALQAGGCSLQLLSDSRGRAAPNTPQQAQGRTENWRRLQQGAGDGRVMAGWRGTGKGHGCWAHMDQQGKRRKCSMAAGTGGGGKDPYTAKEKQILSFVTGISATTQAPPPAAQPQQFLSRQHATPRPAEESLQHPRLLAAPDQ